MVALPSSTLWTGLNQRCRLQMVQTTGGRKTDGMDVDTHKKVGGVTIFRTQNSDMASGIVITKFLFRNGEMYADMDKRTHSNKAVSRGLSFMTLSRDHSDFGHLPVMFNQHARGMVWDWVHRRQEQNQGRSDCWWKRSDRSRHRRQHSVGGG
ncbi:MAG: hypothetical protein J3R72DRAFT_100789 [Linnemannia gamsii]|nr:MAG: hypothetical protein J3R72DRAFT_100789 [Linnemannia gamsii]